MPRGDRTGPEGKGSRTGRRMGFCSGYDTPGFMNVGFGQGFGAGRGLGWRRNAFSSRANIQTNPVVITEKQEKQILEQELSALKQEIKEIENRLKELKK